MGNLTKKTQQRKLAEASVSVCTVWEFITNIWLSLQMRYLCFFNNIITIQRRKKEENIQILSIQEWTNGTRQLSQQKNYIVEFAWGSTIVLPVIGKQWHILLLAQALCSSLKDNVVSVITGYMHVGYAKWQLLVISEMQSQATLYTVSSNAAWHCGCW